MSLKEFGNDIETLTIEYKADSEEQNERLSNLEKDLNEIENGSGDLNQLDPEFEKQLTGLTTLFGEYMKKELIEDIIQWTLLTLLSVYIIDDAWDNAFK